MKKTLLLGFLASILAHSFWGQTTKEESTLLGDLLDVGLEVGLAALEYELWLEEMELMAFRRVLETRYEESACRVKLLSAEAKKITDNSATKAMVFAVTFLDPESQKARSREVLLMMTYPGYVNAEGLEYSKLDWHWFSLAEWNRMKRAFVQMSSPAEFEGDQVKLYQKINPIEFANEPNQISVSRSLNRDDAVYFQSTGELVSLSSLSIQMTGFGVIGSGVEGYVPAYRLGNDDYLYQAYTDDLSLVANERALGLFFRQVGRVIQISRADVRLIESFLYDWSDRFVDQQNKVELTVDGKVMQPFCKKSDISNGDVGYYQAEIDFGGKEIVGKEITLGDAGLLKQRTFTFGKFEVKGVLTQNENQTYKVDDRIYYYDRELLPGRIIDAQLDASRPFIEIEYNTGDELESKKTSPSSPSVYRVSNAGQCNQIHMIEVEFENGEVYVIPPSDTSIFRSL